VRPAPAYVLSPGSDILAENPEGLALLPGLAGWPRARRNIVRYVFLHPAARDVLVSWRRMAEDCVAHLRTVAPGETAAIVAELRAASPDFARCGAITTSAPRAARSAPSSTRVWAGSS